MSQGTEEIIYEYVHNLVFVIVQIFKYLFLYLRYDLSMFVLFTSRKIASMTLNCSDISNNMKCASYPKEYNVERLSVRCVKIIFGNTPTLNKISNCSADKTERLICKPIQLRKYRYIPLHTNVLSRRRLSLYTN